MHANHCHHLLFRQTWIASKASPAHTIANGLMISCALVWVPVSHCSSDPLLQPPQRSQNVSFWTGLHQRKGAIGSARSCLWQPGWYLMLKQSVQYAKKIVMPINFELICHHPKFLSLMHWFNYLQILKWKVSVEPEADFRDQLFTGVAGTVQCSSAELQRRERTHISTTK